MSASTPHRLIRINPLRWRRLISNLGVRGDGGRETGAFLLGRTNRRNGRVKRVVFFDDLQPDSLTGGVHLSHVAFTKLWSICEQSGLRVVGDVHTHPRSHVALSETDRNNPLISLPGHIALIVPNFASKQVDAEHVGVHEYLGDEGWASRFGTEAVAALHISWWS